jgi:hypothetical protein
MSDSSIHRQIVAFSVVKATGNDIGEMKTENHQFRYKGSSLPTWCLNIKTGTLQYTESYLQFVNSGDEEYILFDVIYSDSLISEEISNMGLDDLIEKYDYRKIFSNFKIRAFKDAWKHINSYIRVVYSLHYYGSYDYYSGGTEWDVDIDIIGYFDEELKLIELKDNE